MNATSYPLSAPAAFTLEVKGRLSEIKTPCGISLPYMPGKTPGDHPEITQFIGLWDTGATNSCITPRAVKALGLKPIGVVESHGVHSSALCNVYLVNLYFPNHVALTGLRVAECDLGDSFDILIGMDVIGKSDFAITNRGGNTTFSFRMPSNAKIDFRSEEYNVAATPSVEEKYIGTSRNVLCPCGSGKKYKVCHGK